MVLLSKSMSPVNPKLILLQLRFAVLCIMHAAGSLPFSVRRVPLTIAGYHRVFERGADSEGRDSRGTRSYGDLLASCERPNRWEPE
jgi:hypothetical protein